MTRQLLLLLIIATAVIVIWHLDYFRYVEDFATAQSQQAAQPSKNNKQLTSYLEHFERKQFDDNGHLSNRLLAEHAFKYNTDPDILHIQQPVFYISNANALWRGESDNATVNFNSQLSILDQHVVFSHAEKNINVYTQQLTINNHDKIAFTDQNVELVNEQNKTTASGMSVDFEKQIIELRHNVHSQFLLDTTKSSQQRKHSSTQQ